MRDVPGQALQQGHKLVVHHVFKGQLPWLGRRQQPFPSLNHEPDVLRQRLFQQLGELKGPASFGPAVLQWGFNECSSDYLRQEHGLVQE